MLSTARDSDGSYVSIIYDLLPHSIVAVGGGVGREAATAVDGGSMVEDE